MAQRWRRIEDLPEDWTGLTDGELEPLLQYWNEQREELDQSRGLHKFTTQLSREWAIETGQIEGVYDLDRGLTRTLIEHGINADLIPHLAGQRAPESIAAIVRDHQDVLEGLFLFVRGDRQLSKSYINELHAALLRHQDTATVMDQFGRVFETELVKGRYKQRTNNPTRADGSVDQYCPPEHVESEMDRLISLHAAHVERNVAVEVQAAWLHHRFAQIHPYQDGNGRVARALATLVFVKAGWFPVVITRDDRVRYLDALEMADEGELKPVVSCFVDVQKRALFQAIKVAAGLVEPQDFEQAVEAVRKVVVGSRTVNEPTVRLKAKVTAKKLLSLAQSRFEQAAEVLDQQMASFGFRFASYNIGAQDISDSRDYPSRVMLEIASQSMAKVTLSGRGIGSEFRGLVEISVEFASSHGENLLASEDPFQVNYVESYESTERRFKPWLERSLVRALNLWRQSL